MPMLLEDLAEEASASNRRAADRLDAEARNLGQRRGEENPPEELRQQAIETARLGTEFALSRVPQYEGFMRSAVALLSKQPNAHGAEGLLHTLLQGFKTGQGLIGAVRSLWRIAEQIGVAPERSDELDQAERRLEELASEVQQALEHRQRGWRPADPGRLNQGLQLAREGKTVKEDEARARLRRLPG